MAHPPQEPDLFGSAFVPPIAPLISRSRGLAKPNVPEEKAESAFKTISETAEMLDVPQHVLRFWETKFPQIKPLKLAGGRRYYRPQDIDTIAVIKSLLYREGYTIKGAKRAIMQAKKAKEPIMTQAKPTAKPRKPMVEDAPLFAALAPEIPAPVVPALSAKKQELHSIHGELLELRKLIADLPTLPTHA